MSFCSDAQSANALRPISATPLGITSSFSDAHPQNALAPTTRSVLGSVPRVRARMPLGELRAQVESCLLPPITRSTGCSMTLVTDDYRTVRLTLNDIARLTDDVMGVVFDCLPPISINYEKLNEYALHVQSLSAMRVLYQKYQAFFSEEEYAFLQKMIRAVYPPDDYEAWLEPDGD